MKEYKIGDTFKHDGKIIKCVEDEFHLNNWCNGCFFLDMDYGCINHDVCCSKEDRKDNKNVHFEEVKE